MVTGRQMCKMLHSRTTMHGSYQAVTVSDDISTNIHLASNKTCQVSRKPRGERASALRRAEKGGHHIGKHSALLVRAHKLTLRLPALLHLEECPHTVIPPSTTRRRPGNKSGAGEARAGSKKTRPQQDLPAIILHQQCGTSG